jgi:hypothetical protein
MLKYIKTLIFIIISLTSVELLAHPGHGNFEGNSILHYITSPFHILPFLLLVGVVIFTLVQKHMNKLEKQEIKK